MQLLNVIFYPFQLKKKGFFIQKNNFFNTRNKFYSRLIYVYIYVKFPHEDSTLYKHLYLWNNHCTKGAWW